MTAIEKMAKAIDEQFYKSTCGEANLTPQTAKELGEAALRALIDHIKETGAPEMVRAACTADGPCTLPEYPSCGDGCTMANEIKMRLIAALEEVVKCPD